MKAEAGHGGRLEAAVQKLERSLSMLEQRLAKRLKDAGAEAGDLFDLDRTKLATDLDTARARERELEEAAAQASDALARAIAELKAQAGQPDVGQLTVHINGKPYLLGCEDGDEGRLQALAARLDEKVRATGGADGALGETRLILMGGLMLADEGEALLARAIAAEGEAARLRALLDIADSRAAHALEAAAKKIDSLAAR